MPGNISQVFFLLILSLFYTASSLAKVKPFGVNGGAFIQTKTLYRGALIWSKPSFFFGPSLVFYEKFFVRGPNLSYQFFERKSPYRLNLGLSFFNDRRPIFDFSNEEEGIRNSRSSALDLTLQSGYKFGYRNLFEFGAVLSKDFIEHRSFYFEPHFAFPIAPFTKMRAFLGSGGLDMNSYLYGSDSNNLISHYGFSLTLFLPPFLLPKFVPKGAFLFSLDHTSVVGSENRAGRLLDGAPDNLNFGVRYFCKFY